MFILTVSCAAYFFLYCIATDCIKISAPKFKATTPTLASQI